MGIEIDYDPAQHRGCPMFLTQQEAENFIRDSMIVVDTVPVLLAMGGGFRMWAVVPAKTTIHCPLVTMRVLISGAETVQGLVDMIHGCGHDCWVDYKGMVEVDADYKWDNSFFEKEKC